MKTMMLVMMLYGIGWQKPAEPPKASPLEEAIAGALRQHPDVKLAEAKRLVADAELEQAKLAVTQKITNAFARVEQARARVALAESQYERAKRRAEVAQAAAAEIAKFESELQSAKAEYAMAEADLLAAKGGAKAPITLTNAMVEKALIAESPFTKTNNVLVGTNPIASPAPRLHAAIDATLRNLIDRRITLKVDDVPFTEAMEMLKAAAGEKNIMFRIPDGEKLPKIAKLSGEQTFHSWMQIVMDDLAEFSRNSEELTEPGVNGRPPSKYYRKRSKYGIYVRDYGLLITAVEAAPVGAMTLDEYVNQVHSQKPVKP